MNLRKEASPHLIDSLDNDWNWSRKAEYDSTNQAVIADKLRLLTMIFIA
jgi:hypothetical protein